MQFTLCRKSILNNVLSASKVDASYCFTFPLRFFFLFYFPLRIKKLEPRMAKSALADQHYGI